MRATTLRSKSRPAHEREIPLPHGSLRCALLRSMNIPFAGWPYDHRGRRRAGGPDVSRREIKRSEASHSGEESPDHLPQYRPHGGLLHAGVVGAAAALRYGPDDILRRVLDIASLAMHTILRVDLEDFLAARLDNFVNAGRAIALRGLVVVRQVETDRHGVVVQFEV